MKACLFQIFDNFHAQLATLLLKVGDLMNIQNTIWE
jgi:hypothetical protein